MPQHKAPTKQKPSKKAPAAAVKAGRLEGDEGQAMKPGTEPRGAKQPKFRKER